MMPAWATVLLALGVAALTGFLGAWLGAWMQGRHDRRERLRDRRIEAADEATRAFADALLQVSGAQKLIEVSIESQIEEEMETARLAFNKAAAHINEAAARTARLDLLFLLGSDVNLSASRLVSQLRVALAYLEPPEVNTAASTQRHLWASETMEVLTLAASVAIAETGTRSDPLRNREAARAKVKKALSKPPDS